MYGNEREQQHSSYDLQLDEAVCQLAQQLAPRAGISETDAPPPFRAPRPSSFLFILLLVVALIPSLGLAMIGLSSPDLRDSLRIESRKAAATISVLPSMLGSMGSKQPKSRVEHGSVSSVVAIAPTVVDRNHQKERLSASEEAVADDVVPTVPEGGMEEGPVSAVKKSEDSEAAILSDNTNNVAEKELASAPDLSGSNETEFLSEDASSSEEELASASAQSEDSETAFLSEDTSASEEELASAPAQSEDSETAFLSEDTSASEEELASAPAQSEDSEKVILSEHTSAAEDRFVSSPEQTEADPLAATSDVAINPKAAVVLRPEEADRVQSLMDHGHKMIEVGYFAGARAYFKRAAEAGSGEAALALGATYDAQFIDEVGAHGIEPQPAEARFWYERALSLRMTGAEAKLVELARKEGLNPDRASQRIPLRAQRLAFSPVEPANSEPPSTSESLSAQSEAWVELTGAANLRRAPSQKGEAMRVITKGTKLRIMASEAGWLRVTDPETETIGWIYSKAVDISPSRTP